MSTSSLPAPTQPLTERVREAAELLEAIVADRALLAELPEAERTRLLRAAGQASRPDAVGRRQLVKATKRERKAARVQREESVLQETGIRRLRREAVFQTPNLFPPVDRESGRPDEAEHGGEAPAVLLGDGGQHVAQNCYVCKRD